MSCDNQLIKAIADLTHPFKPSSKKCNSGLLEVFVPLSCEGVVPNFRRKQPFVTLQASLADKRDRDSVYLAILERVLVCTDQCDTRSPVITSQPLYGLTVQKRTMSVIVLNLWGCLQAACTQ
jgi:hypothetical protein